MFSDSPPDMPHQRDIPKTSNENNISTIHFVILYDIQSKYVPVTHRSLNNTGRMLSMAKTTSSVTDWTVMASVVDVSFCSVVPAYFGTDKKKQFCRRHIPSHVSSTYYICGRILG